MGSEFLTLPEAVRRLGRCERTVYGYIRKGFIRKTKEHGKLVLYKEDVEQLTTELIADLPALTRKNFYQLTQRLIKLEQQMAVVRHCLEIKDNMLRPQKEEIPTFLALASHLLSQSDWSKEQATSWAHILSGVDEVTLNLLSENTVHAKPWETLYRLCLALMGYASAQHWDELHDILERARRQMRSTILIWLELHAERVPKDFQRVLDTNVDDLVRRLTGK